MHVKWCFNVHRSTQYVFVLRCSLWFLSIYVSARNQRISFKCICPDLICYFKLLSCMFYCSFCLTNVRDLFYIAFLNVHCFSEARGCLIFSLRFWAPFLIFPGFTRFFDFSSLGKVEDVLRNFEKLIPLYWTCVMLVNSWVR